MKWRFAATLYTLLALASMLLAILADAKWD